MVLPSDILLEAYNETTVPALILIYIIYSLIFLIIGHLSVSTSSSHKRIWLIWFLSALAAGIVILIFVYFKASMLDLIKFFVK